MADEHAPVERALRRDISTNNALRKQLAGLEGRVARWSAKAKDCRNKRQRKKLEATIERTRPAMKSMVERLRSNNGDLKKRIQEEMKFSEEEVRQLQERYRKEHAEFLKAAAAARNARRQADDLSKEAPATTARKVHRRIGRAERAVRAEGKDVKDVQKELDSEARDKIFFERELSRILAGVGE